MDDAIVAGLKADLLRQRPSLLVVSGDLTQRARRRQFVAARRFLDDLPIRSLIVPGNHDIPLFDVFRRFLRPLARYKHHIDADTEPLLVDDEIQMLGLNTARPDTWRNGRISDEQVARIRSVFSVSEPARLKVLVTHHAFLPPPGNRSPALVAGAGAALQALEDCGADLLLAGHLHRGYTGDVRTHHLAIRRSMVVAQAGTAASTRRRGEPNAYNLLTLDLAHITIESRSWTGREFAPAAVTRCSRSGDGWSVERADRSAAGR